MNRWLVISVVSTLILAACATSPTGRRQLRLVSETEMSKMGATAFTQLKTKTPVTQNPKASSYVQCVSKALTDVVGGSWEIQTFESKDVNAFALPGGKIGVYTGLLKVASSQDQLAAVIGHEITHVLAGHSAARVSNQMATQLGAAVVAAGTGMSPELIGTGANYLLILPNSRGDETESDVLGMQLMARAGFNPSAAITLWQNMAKASGGQAPPEFASTHPSNQTRIQDLQRDLPKAMPLYEQARASGRKPNCGASPV